MTDHGSLFTFLDRDEAEQRIVSARQRIESVQRELKRWDWVNWQSSQRTFDPQVKRLQEALDLLDAEVKLA